jgi:hypothetical protein
VPPPAWFAPGAPPLGAVPLALAVPGVTVFAAPAAPPLARELTASALDTAALLSLPPSTPAGQFVKTWAETSTTNATIAIETRVTLEAAPTRYLRACRIMDLD